MKNKHVMGYFDMVKLLLLFKRYVHHCTRAPFFSFFLSSIPFPQVFLYWTNASKVHASQAKATPDTSVMCFGYIIISVISHQSAVSLVFQTLSIRGHSCPTAGQSCPSECCWSSMSTDIPQRQSHQRVGF